MKLHVSLAATLALSITTAATMTEPASGQALSGAISTASKRAPQGGCAGLLRAAPTPADVYEQGSGPPAQMYQQQPTGMPRTSMPPAGMPMESGQYVDGSYGDMHGGSYGDSYGRTYGGGSCADGSCGNGACSDCYGGGYGDTGCCDTCGGYGSDCCCGGFMAWNPLTSVLPTRPLFLHGRFSAHACQLQRSGFVSRPAG